MEKVITVLRVLRGLVRVLLSRANIGSRATPSGVHVARIKMKFKRSDTFP